MPENDVVDEQPPPRFVALFAPWRWFNQMRSWKRWTLTIGLMVCAYIEFPAFIIPFMHTRKGLPVPMEQAYAVVWYPIDLLIQASPAVAFFYYWQADIILEFMSWLGI